jgi:hypothetical protein
MGTAAGIWKANRRERKSGKAQILGFGLLWGPEPDASTGRKPVTETRMHPPAFGGMTPRYVESRDSQEDFAEFSERFPFLKRLYGYQYHHTDHQDGR